MSFLRTSVLRLSRPIATRGYADKSMAEKAGDMLKKAGGAFKSDGAVGKQFEGDGAIGSKGNAVGGPLASDGAVGKQFTDKGAVGGTIDETAKDVKREGEEMKKSNK